MLNRCLTFIRTVNLDSKVPSELRADALDILLDAKKSETEGSLNGTITGTPKMGDVNVKTIRVDGRSIALDVNIYDAIRTMIRNNLKIQAIKLFRGLAGIGLKEAKDAIDNLENWKLYIEAATGKILERY